MDALLQPRPALLSFLDVFQVYRFFNSENKERIKQFHLISDRRCAQEHRISHGSEAPCMSQDSCMAKKKQFRKI